MPDAARLRTRVLPVKYSNWKRLLDFLIALVLLVPVVPIIGILVLLVRCTSPGPGLFQQLRVGRYGRRFTLYKIRTMRLDAELPGTGAVWAQANDPRATPLGSWLRRSHLDELPQLFNVLRGEMSFVGPRPERPEFVVVLAKKIPGYRRRLGVLPGITGLAQVNLAPDTNLESVRRKLVLDIAYVETMGPWLDLRLMACTGSSLLGVANAYSSWLLGLQRSVACSDEALDRNDLQPEPATLPLAGHAGITHPLRGGTTEPNAKSSVKPDAQEPRPEATPESIRVQIENPP